MTDNLNTTEKADEAPKDTPTNESLSEGMVLPTTRSTDGYLYTNYKDVADGYVHGAHPDHGDTVYERDGTDLGKITFFYAQLNARTWLVQVEGQKEDPMYVTAETELHEDGSRRLAWWLCAIPGEAARVGNNTLGVRVFTK